MENIYTDVRVYRVKHLTMIFIPSLVQVLSRAVPLSCIELEAGKYICVIKRGIYRDMTKWIFVQSNMDCL